MTTDDRSHEVDHVVARLAGEEGRDHPRQKAVAWLEEHGCGISAFNEAFGSRMRGFNTAATATFGALYDAFGPDFAREVFRATRHPVGRCAAGIGASGAGTAPPADVYPENQPPIPPWVGP